uniref:Uncharacterized protein n=1 Tax=Clastoptera arizonana TaxID=38151 RepID=A0A1B6DS99_9HEMI
MRSFWVLFGLIVFLAFYLTNGQEVAEKRKEGKVLSEGEIPPQHPPKERIFNTPSLRCPAGTGKDRRGTCRTLMIQCSQRRLERCAAIAREGGDLSSCNCSNFNRNK